MFIQVKFTFNTILHNSLKNYLIKFRQLNFSNFWDDWCKMVLGRQKWRLAQNMAPVKNWCHANWTLCAKCSHKIYITCGKMTSMQNWHHAKTTFQAKTNCVKVTCEIDKVGINLGEKWSVWIDRYGNRFGWELLS